MTDQPPIQPPKLSVAYSATAELTVELGKILVLVAPVSMTVEQQQIWLLGAADALDGIRPQEVQAVSAELRRSVTRHSQIVPEISRLVAAKRARTSLSGGKPVSKLFEIEREAEKRRKAAHTQREIEESAEWERASKIQAGLPVPPREPALSRDELETMPSHVRDLGLARGLLEYRDGMLCEVRP